MSIRQYLFWGWSTPRHPGKQLSGFRAVGVMDVVSICIRLPLAKRSQPTSHPHSSSSVLLDHVFRLFLAVHTTNRLSGKGWHRPVGNIPHYYYSPLCDPPEDTHVFSIVPRFQKLSMGAHRHDQADLIPGVGFI